MAKETVKNTCVMLPVKLRKQAQRLAAKEDRTFSQVLRALLREYVAQSEQRLSA